MLGEKKMNLIYNVIILIIFMNIETVIATHIVGAKWAAIDYASYILTSPSAARASAHDCLNGWVDVK